MIRTVALAMFVAIDATFGRIVAQAAGAGGPTDPIQILTSLGVGGIVAMPVYLWQRFTASLLAKAMATIERQAETSSQLVHAIEQNTEAQRAATTAATEMNRLVEYRWPRER